MQTTQMCVNEPFPAFFFWFAAFLAFLIVYSRFALQRARSECVGHCGEFWLTFLGFDRSRGDFLFDRSTFLTQVDDRDVDTLLRQRRRYMRVFVLSFVVWGAVLLALLRPCS